MAPIIERNREQIVALCKRYGITRLDVFGSAARGTDFDEATSDADFFYEFDTSRPTLADDYFGFVEALQTLLGRPVDLVSIRRAGERPYFLEMANRDRRPLYAA
jgi:predicted nucleotidyltransferase